MDVPRCLCRHAPACLAIALGLAAFAAPARAGCNQPPTPGPGDTVTWTAAGGPYDVCATIVIPATSTVIVEPGTSIDIADGIEIEIMGTLLVQGTQQSPVTITGESFFVFNHPLEVFGLAQIDFATVTCRMHVRGGGSLLAADSTFSGALATDSGRTYVQIDRCDFPSGDLDVAHGTLAVRDTTVSGESVSAGGFLLADGLAIDGGNLTLSRARAAQTAYVNDVTVTNFSSGPGLSLSGWNFFLGQDNVLQNNLYPVGLAGGLVPGSTVPATGNVINAVDAGNGGYLGVATWSDVGVPYRVDGVSASGAHLTVEAGTLVEFAAASGITRISTGRFRAYGHPDDPITFRGLGGAQWNGIAFQSNVTGPALKHCIVEDAFMGVASADTPIANVSSCLFRNNFRGVNASTFGILEAHDCIFQGNDTGARETANGTVRLGDAASPNSFTGNTIAVDGTLDTVDAQHCWWGDPSGPQHPGNPGGAGDPAVGSVSFVPFLTAAPDPDDHPPVVRMMKPFGLLETGAKVMIVWDAQDDGTIVSQRVLFSQHGNYSFTTLAGDLPGTQRSYELTVPTVFPSSDNNPTFIRIVAVDDAGQESFDEHPVFVPYLEDVTGALVPDSYTGTFTVGENEPVCWTVAAGSGTIGAALLFDGGDLGVGLGGAHTGVECLSLGMQMPAVSTDTARVQLNLNLGAGGRTAYFYSNEFTIRPDSRMGDDPPVVEMTGATASGGGGCGVTIPITWTASDDTGLRSFDIQASYDGGRTWHFIVRDLPPDERSYDWQVTPIDGIPDVRVRVMARDLRFQTTTDGGAQPFAIPPGGGTAVGDLDGDCTVGTADLLALLAAWGPCAGACPADLSGDGIVGATDLLLLLANWG